MAFVSQDMSLKTLCTTNCTAVSLRGDVFSSRLSSRKPAVGFQGAASRAYKARGKFIPRAKSETGCGLTEDDECECDDYVPLALARCYEQTPNGLEDLYIIEPVTAGSLESLINGAKTTYVEVTGTTIDQALTKQNNVLPVSFKDAKFCEDFEFRAKCATRTWLRPHPQENLLDVVPVGETRGGWNMDEENKRVLNMENIVNDSDNIKQDMSIDVYNREEGSEEDEIEKAYNA